MVCSGVRSARGMGSSRGGSEMTGVIAGARGGPWADGDSGRDRERSPGRKGTSKHGGVMPESEGGYRSAVGHCGASGGPLGGSVSISCGRAGPMAASPWSERSSFWGAFSF